MSDGATPEEAIQNGRDAIKSYLLSCREFGDPIPEPGSQSPVAIPTNLRSRLNDRAQRQKRTASDLAAQLLTEGLEKCAESLTR